MKQAAAIARIKNLLGPRGWLERAAEMAPFLVEPRGLYHGAAALVAQPETTADVAAVVSICAEARVPVVPRGGGTGLCGGAVPGENGNEVVISLARLNKIRDIDPDGYSMIAEAGCLLADLQRAAVEADRLFPLSMASEGSCRIGGNLSTNAGGVAVLRYGVARDLALGLEVVLADGRTWSGLRPLRKDATGYDLKNLFIGAEGTLGIITAAALKLFPLPGDRVTCLLAVPDPAAALALLALIRERTGDAVSAFELIPRIALDFVLRHLPGARDPLAGPHPWYVLVELTGPAREPALKDTLEEVIEGAVARALVTDGVIAASLAQARSLWRLRESISEVQKREGASIKHDISVPLSAMPDFIARAQAAVSAAIPGCRPVIFGHVGDGNVHFNLSQPVAGDRDAFLDRWAEINRLVHDIAVALGGSFSAEHGIGRLKRGDMGRYKSAVEIDLMRTLKRALDPAGIMNPGKLLP